LTQDGRLTGPRGASVLEALNQADRNATDLIQQIADGERIHLQIWLQSNGDGVLSQ
jgi:hypothetical protein